MLTVINGWAQKVSDNPNHSNEPHVFNTSWRNEETGEWVISLFNDNAVYNNKVWQYDKKSDKKIVLSSDNEKIAITIGKEKEGKRLFNIGGKKQMLSAITTNSICDYPIADETSFSTELKEGNAVVSGWLRYPKEILQNSLTVNVSHDNVATCTSTLPTGRLRSRGRTSSRSIISRLPIAFTTTCQPTNSMLLSNMLD